MTNPLTGDFDAVVQVAGRTINRLMATLHQNAGTQTTLPTHPHVISFRINENDDADGVFGWLSAQIGVPQIVLLDRGTDRFDLEIPLRARFLAETGSADLPEYIHGTVRATYKMAKIDENCQGWRTRAADYLWLRVIKNSVRFTGTATDDIPLPYDAGSNARIERVVADLLDYRFEAAPHPVRPEFQPGRMISLNHGGQDAVALGIDLAGGKPGGKVSSINQVFAGGHDFAVAVTTEWLLGQFQPVFDQLTAPVEYRGKTTTRIYGPFGIKLDTIETEVHTTTQITSYTYDWRPHGFGSSIHFVLNGEIRGTANATFTVEDVVGVDFSSQDESLTFMHGANPDVRVSADVAWYLDLLGFDDNIENKIRETIRTSVSNALADIPPIPLAGYHAELGKQLQTLDASGTARFVDADFRQEGIVLQGRIGLTARRPPVVEFTKLPDESGFSALTAWAPGGWIERFVWTYRPGYLAAQSQTQQHRYVLTRPPGRFSRWGKQSFKEPVPRLPGLDGSGEICLEIQGYQIDSVTGNRVSFRAKTCQLFGGPPSIARNDHVGRLLTVLRSAPGPAGRPRELGVVELSTPGVNPAAANSLVVYTDGGLDADTAQVLAAGLDASVREDAGLTVLLLVDEKAGATHGADLAAEADALSDRIGAHVQIIENVAQSWTRRLSMTPDTPGWRLITPNGGFTWAHDGPIASDELAAVLDDHLRPCPRMTFEPMGTILTEGSAVPPWAVPATMPSPGQRRHCPRILTIPRSYYLAFVQSDSQPSQDQLAEWQRARAAGPPELPPLLAVVDGNKAQVLQISERYSDVEVLPDPAGVISDRFGVRIWPTIVGVEDGVITGIRHGLVNYDAPPPVSWSHEYSASDPRESGSAAT